MQRSIEVRGLDLVRERAIRYCKTFSRNSRKLTLISAKFGQLFVQASRRSLVSDVAEDDLPSLNSALKLLTKQQNSLLRTISKKIEYQNLTELPESNARSAGHRLAGANDLALVGSQKKGQRPNKQNLILPTPIASCMFSQSALSNLPLLSVHKLFLSYR